MMRNPATTVRFPVFDFDVRVIVARNLKSTGRRLQVDLSGATAAYVKRSDEPKRGWLLLPPSPDAATVAHESAHCVAHIFNVHGVRRDDEAFAYHLDYLVGRIHGFLKRKKGKR